MKIIKAKRRAILLLLPAIFFISLAGISQSSFKITGKVLNNKNEPLPSISVNIKGGTKGASTDMEGRFVITGSSEKSVSIEISAVGYRTKTLSDVIPGSEELNVVLEAVSKNLENVTVTASSARKETVSSLITFQKNTNTVASVISAEAIRRSPDKNTGEVLKRVPGTTLQEGKYIVVRGLNDRYNQAMLNGILLSSTEPDRKTFSFDLFPAPMVDNIIMNKGFVPELPGEWAGGLVQVQTKEIPSSNFLNVQVGTGFNSNTIGKDFYQAPGGKLDWLGIEDGKRSLPSTIPNKIKFSQLSQADKNEFGKQFGNVWSAKPGSAPLNSSFQINGGFNGKLLNKKVGGVVALVYNQSNTRTPFDNAILANSEGKVDLFYNNNRYSRDVLAGVLANFSVLLNANNRISFKNILNVNTSDFAIDRYNGRDFILGPISGDKVKAQEIGFRQNTFFNTQLIGEHNIPKYQAKLKWYGGFNILDQYTPDQRRLFYTQSEDDPSGKFIALLGSGASQKSGSIFHSNLSDYIYNAGGDLTKSFELLGQKQSIKGGYLFQVKDRLFDSRPFFANTTSTSIKELSPDQIFAPQNFGTTDNSVQFGELIGSPYRYLANSILNAGYIQLDNSFSNKWRVIWGVRVENFDQLIGCVKTSDPRHVHSEVRDFLPGVNLTYKPTQQANIRLSGSQTIVRPEFRELSPFAFYDFELNAQVIGNAEARRTKITNLDLRYELYPRAGEMATLGVFYKHFKDPIEYYFNQTGPATNTFNIQNSNSANAYGVELEFRKKLDFINLVLKNFTVTGNFSYIHSRVKDTVALDRPLQGQSPYIVNLGLQYDEEKSGLTANLLFNQIGRRILFVGNEAIPNIWENPRPLVDFQLAKKVMNKKGEMKISITDLLNKTAYFYHDLDGNGRFTKNSPDAIAINRSYGTNYSITFAYAIK